MEFQTLLETRRSMRKYDASKAVTKEQIETVVKAAQLAPSWKNSQTARYYAIIDAEKRAEFASKVLPSFNAVRSEGAAYIVTTFVKNVAGFSDATTPTNELSNEWGSYDLGLQNMCLMLKAKELGLDTLVMGIRDAAQIREMLGITEDEIIVAVLAIGYGAASPEMPERNKTEDILKVY